MNRFDYLILALEIFFFVCGVNYLYDNFPIYLTVSLTAAYLYLWFRGFWYEYVRLKRG